jgi:hypothetical protein
MKMHGSIVSNRTIIAVSPPTNEVVAVGAHEVKHLQILICDCQDQTQPPNLKVALKSYNGSNVSAPVIIRRISYRLRQF